jgi:hypothetical protein
MKKLYSLILLFAAQTSFAQVTFWTEDFITSTCGSGTQANGYITPNGTWTVTPSGANDPEANLFFISAKENGNGAGNCGSACGTNHTLHVGANDGFVLDQGASYDAGGLCSSFSICVETNSRAESPVIDCSQYHLMTVTFNYMEFGDNSIDDATFWVYDGITWTQLDALAKTACCGGPCNGNRQGQWTSITLNMPASTEYNPNVKLGFNWTNNDDGAGTDPSFAVDDIQVTGRLVLSVSELSSASIHLYPNPATNELTISYPGGFSLSYLIRDISGREIMKSTTSAQLEDKIDISGIYSGCYFVQILDGNRLISSSRFIKQ